MLLAQNKQNHKHLSAQTLVLHVRLFIIYCILVELPTQAGRICLF